MAVKKSLKNLKFDEALAMLEEKVKLLEEGNLPLEESLEVFKEGIELSKICAGRLDTARQTVEQSRKKAFPAWMKPWHTAFLQAASAYARFF